MLFQQKFFCRRKKCETKCLPAGPRNEPPMAPPVTKVDFVDDATALLAFCKSSLSPVIAAEIP